MGDALQLAHLGDQVGHRDAEGVGGGDGASDVQDIVGADQPGGKAVVRPVPGDGEGGAFGRDPDVPGEIIGVLPLDTVLNRRAGGVLGADVFVIPVEEDGAVRREGIPQLKFGFDNIVDRLEALEVLGADRGKDTEARVDDVADFLDVADVPGPHLAEEDLVGRAEGGADRLDDAHRRVVALGGHQDVEFCREELAEEELDTRLAVAAGDADHLEGGHFFQHPLGVVDIPVVDPLFNRAVDKIGGEDVVAGGKMGGGKDNPQPQRDPQRAGSHRRDEEGEDGGQQGQQAEGDEHPLDPGGVNQRLFGLPGASEVGGEGEEEDGEHYPHLPAEEDKPRG